MIENSWGNDKQDVFKGHFTMSEKWFDDYVYMVVVDKDFVDNKVKLENQNNETKVDSNVDTIPEADFDMIQVSALI